MYNTAEQQVYVVGQWLGQWRRGGGVAALEEAQKQILALLEVCRELQARTQ